MIPAAAYDLVDAALEASVVGSFSRVGFLLRRRLGHFAALPSMRGRVVVLTGATSGIGRTAATALAALGAELHLVGRDAGRLESLEEELTPLAGAVTCYRFDLAELDQARELAELLAERCPRVDALVHNAGALSARLVRNSAGIEATLATQLLAPYLLTRRLLPALERASGRVVFVASGGLYGASHDLDALEPNEASYRGARQYARVKRAQLLLATEWQRSLAIGVSAFAVHPGWVDTPGLRSGLPGFARLLSPLLRKPEEGADTLLALACGLSDDEPPRAHARHDDPLAGALWHDRRRRAAYRPAWRRPSDEELVASARELVAFCERMSAPAS